MLSGRCPSVNNVASEPSTLKGEFTRVLFRWPDAEFTAAMEHGHHVKEPLVVAFQTVGCGRVPQRLDKILGARISGGEAGVSIDGDQALSVARFQLAAIQRELTAVIGHSLAGKERLKIVAELPFTDIFAPPRPVHRPVARGAKGVVGKIVGAASAGPVEI